MIFAIKYNCTTRTCKTYQILRSSHLSAKRFGMKSLVCSRGIDLIIPAAWQDTFKPRALSDRFLTYVVSLMHHPLCYVLREFLPSIILSCVWVLNTITRQTATWVVLRSHAASCRRRPPAHLRRTTVRHCRLGLRRSGNQWTGLSSLKHIDCKNAYPLNMGHGGVPLWNKYSWYCLNSMRTYGVTTLDVLFYPTLPRSWMAQAPSSKYRHRRV